VLASGEVGVEVAPGTSPPKIKIGNGANKWSELPYVTDSIAADILSLQNDVNLLQTGKVAKSGDTMTGMLTLPSTTPSVANHATRKGYVDTQDALKVAKAGDTMTGDLRIEAPNAEGLYVGSDSDQVTDTKSIKVQSRGYAGILLDGDTDNVAGEPGGAFVRLQQDGGLVSGRLGMVQLNGDDGEGGSYSGSIANSFLIGTDGNVRVQFGTNGTVRMALAGNGDLDIGGLNNWSTGRNANGRWIRTPDGLQRCWAKVSINHTAGLSSATRLAGTWTFPISFSTTEDLTVQMSIPAHTGAAFVNCSRTNVISWGPQEVPGTTSTAISVFFTGGVSTTNAALNNISVTAFGRWF
jgi:hypothetical protein